MSYLAVKWLHLSCAALSIAGFAARGVLMLSGSPLLQARFVRIAPHVVDTVLLGSAIWLALFLHQYPFADSWLTAKLAALIAYIGLGSVALRHGRTRAVRAGAFAGALLVAGYIVSVAYSRDPRAALAWMLS